MNQYKAKIKSMVFKEYRNNKMVYAFKKIFDDPKNKICLSIGGGGTGGGEKKHPKLIILDLCPFPNNDILADAHRLPYTKESVDAIDCEAVIT